MSKHRSTIPAIVLTILICSSIPISFGIMMSSVTITNNVISTTNGFHTSEGLTPIYDENNGGWILDGDSGSGNNIVTPDGSRHSVEVTVNSGKLFYIKLIIEGVNGKSSSIQISFKIDGETINLGKITANGTHYLYYKNGTKEITDYNQPPSNDNNLVWITSNNPVQIDITATIKANNSEQDKNNVSIRTVLVFHQ